MHLHSTDRLYVSNAVKTCGLDVVPMFRNRLWVPSQDQHWYITIYFVTSHEVRIFSEKWFFCLKFLSSGVFARIFVTNSASNPVAKVFMTLHCDCTCTLSHIAGTACRLQSIIHGVSLRQTGTSGSVSALAGCKFLDIHILLRFYITVNRSTKEQRPR